MVARSFLAVVPPRLLAEDESHYFDVDYRGLVDYNPNPTSCLLLATSY
jgi:hypothetical protein